MDGADFFLNLAHREEDREWRKEDRAWRAEERRWKRLDRQWRSEDRRWRRNDRRYRILDDARRKTDEWAEMINDIANVSALLAGFATAALVPAERVLVWGGGTFAFCSKRRSTYATLAQPTAHHARRVCVPTDATTVQPLTTVQSPTVLNRNL